MTALSTTLRRAVLLALAGLGGTSRAEGQSLAGFTKNLPDVPAPPQGDVWWISKSMRMNGLPMTLKNFRSRLNPDAVCDYYRDNLHPSAAREFLQKRNGDWSLLSIRSQRELITVQVRPTRLGSEGTITVSPPPENFHVTLDTDFPKSATATVVNLQEYEDAGVQAEHISMTSTRSVAAEAQSFVQHLLRSGWRIVLRERMQTVPRGQFIEAQNGAQHATLALVPDRDRPAVTAIVVVWKKS